MASKHRGASRPGGSGGQSRLLQLLRRHGFGEELPPSTVSWLDSRPVFRWLAEHLSDENFVSSETQRLYDAIQLQAGASSSGAGDGGVAAGAAAPGGVAHGRAQLMSAMGFSSGSGSDSDNEGEVGGHAEGGSAWDEAQDCEELERAVEVRSEGLGQGGSCTLASASLSQPADILRLHQSPSFRPAPSSSMAVVLV
jgi:hypothetical protein